jgi:hypothetical protein
VFQVILNDFGASVLLGTVVHRHFITTHMFMSPRVQFAKMDDSDLRICYTGADDYAALFFVLLEFCTRGAVRKLSSARRLLFFQVELTQSFFEDFNSFALFLCEFHAALRPVMTSCSVPISDADMTHFMQWTCGFLTTFQTPQSVLEACSLE